MLFSLPDLPSVGFLRAAAARPGKVVSLYGEVCEVFKVVRVKVLHFFHVSHAGALVAPVQEFFQNELGAFRFQSDGAVRFVFSETEKAEFGGFLSGLGSVKNSLNATVNFDR